MQFPPMAGRFSSLAGVNYVSNELGTIPSHEIGENTSLGSEARFGAACRQCRAVSVESAPSRGFEGAA